MNKLKNLVPPLELCKQLPEGAFKDSALVWKIGAWDPVIMEREVVDDSKWIIAPAPALAEILEALPACTCYRIGKTWTVALCNDTLGNGVKSRRAATAALRLWLEVEGVKDE